MSWYSKIYTFVREYRSRKPITGWILTRLLNIFLIIQITGIFLTLYVYIFITIGYYVTNSIQSTIYLMIAFLLVFMSLWSLTRTILTPPARVPDKYRPSKELEDRLKATTPCVNGKYVVEKSTHQQIKEQNSILEAMCREMNIKVAECDQVGRIKYCYECGHIKPDRTRHCSSCGSCCLKFDHHCPWINTCVTHSNYKFFLLYVFYTSFYIYWYLITSIECILRYFIIQKWVEDLSYILIYIFTFLMSLIVSYYPLGELLIFHWQLLSFNETTVEQTKPAVLRFDNLADYNMGRAANFKQVFGWGLYMIPIDTCQHDGLHYDIRYFNEHGIRLMRTMVEGEQMASENNNATGSHLDQE